MQKPPLTPHMTGKAEAQIACTGVVKRDAAQLTATGDFVQSYMAANLPVAITGITIGWRASREWVQPTTGAVDLDAMEALAGTSAVCVTDVNRQVDDASTTHDMTFGQYAAWWRQHQAQRAQLPQSRPTATAVCSLPELQEVDLEKAAEQCRSKQSQDKRQNLLQRSHEQEQPSPWARQGHLQHLRASEPLLYLKDWHFASAFPNWQAYTTPAFFSDDWLNAYYDAKAAEHLKTAPTATLTMRDGTFCSAAQHTLDVDIARPCTAATSTAAQSNTASRTAVGASVVTADYRFVYLGPAGCWTPLHADVLRSSSWSTNVAGRKRWLLLAPQHTHLLLDRHQRQMAPHFELERLGLEAEAHLYPGLAEARTLALEYLQEAGEALFVPSGWHHCVENLEDTLSINHNWLNRHNLQFCKEYLLAEHMAAAAAIDDCRALCSCPAEFDALVQRNIAANAGMDLLGFAALLTFVAERELRCLSTAAELGVSAQKQEHVANLKAAGDALRSLLQCATASGAAGTADTDSLCTAGIATVTAACTAVDVQQQAGAAGSSADGLSWPGVARLLLRVQALLSGTT